MISNSKISAFTISEMIVVLILTSIIIGLAFSVLTLVQRHMKDIKTNYNQSAMIQGLESKLWLDMNRSTQATFDEIKNELILTSEIDSISYQFHKEYIISSTDTFPIEIENHFVFFAGKIIEEGSIDALKLETTKAYGHRTIFIYKYNDATAFMN